VQKTLISDDLDYWRQQKLWLKPGDRPLMTHTRTEAGCPFDCGLCPITSSIAAWRSSRSSACNLACPVCFADAEDVHGAHLPVATVERMLERAVLSEGEPISSSSRAGADDHPQFFEILDAVKARPIRHVMINQPMASDRAGPGVRRAAGQLCAAAGGVSPSSTASTTRR